MEENNRIRKGKEKEEGEEKGKVVEKLCRRCKQTFDPSTNHTSSCRFHPSFFVSRRDDDQRYYELGPDEPPYAANFYECCGAEDPDALGCKTDSHITYDESEDQEVT